MKKIFIALFALAMVFAMAGCSASGASDLQSNPQSVVGDFSQERELTQDEEELFKKAVAGLVGEKPVLYNGLPCPGAGCRARSNQH